jgi:hypothetical protein
MLRRSGEFASHALPTEGGLDGEAIEMAAPPIPANDQRSDDGALDLGD